MARSTKTGGSSRKKKNRKHGRNKIKCDTYRRRIGKPNGPGRFGNKAGKGRYLRRDWTDFDLGLED